MEPNVTMESWENTYSAFDRKACRDWTGMLIQQVESFLPKPEISPTCKRKGHLWKQMPSWFRREHFPKAWSEIFACERCAKRGMVVFRTDGYRDAAA